MDVLNWIGNQLLFISARITMHIIQFLPNKRIAPAVFPIKPIMAGESYKNIPL